LQRGFSTTRHHQSYKLRDIPALLHIQYVQYKRIQDRPLGAQSIKYSGMSCNVEGYI
jgi:hypothetical protein